MSKVPPNDLQSIHSRENMIPWIAGNEVIIKNVTRKHSCVFVVLSSAFLGFPLLH